MLPPPPPPGYPSTPPVAGDPSTLPPPPWAQSRPPPPAATRAATAERSTRNTVAAAVGLFGAVLVGASTFLPWAELTTSLVRSATVTASGWDWFDDSVRTGPLFAVLALAAAVLVGLVFARVNNLGVRIALVSIGVVAFAIALFTATDLVGQQDTAEVIGSVDVSLSYGLYLLFLGTFALVGAGIATDHTS